MQFSLSEGILYAPWEKKQKKYFFNQSVRTVIATRKAHARDEYFLAQPNCCRSRQELPNLTISEICAAIRDFSEEISDENIWRHGTKISETDGIDNSLEEYLCHLYLNLILSTKPSSKNSEARAEK
jgi:hypothetical protein